MLAIVLLLGGVVAWGTTSPAPSPCLRGFCPMAEPPHRLHTELAMVLWAGGLVSLGAALRIARQP